MCSLTKKKKKEIGCAVWSVCGVYKVCVFLETKLNNNNSKPGHETMGDFSFWFATVRFPYGLVKMERSSWIFLFKHVS